jgi:SAM-dependent methyltransferase
VKLARVLSNPRAFRFCTALAGGPRARRNYVDEFVRPKSGDRILDIGCGTGDILACLPDCTYVGFDSDREYVAAATRRFGARGRFFCADVTAVLSNLPFEASSFDIVMANGVLHHLPDGAAKDLLRLAATAMKPTGRLVTHDGCYADGQSRIARYLLSMDRGRHVRRERAYLDLASSVFEEVNATIRHRATRLPYTHLFMECRQAKTMGVARS